MPKKDRPKPDKKFEELQQQAAEYLEGWKRCKADFENFRIQQEKLKITLRQYATEDILIQTIPVVDNFELAANHISETPENKLWLEGILHIKKQLEDVLFDNGVKIIEAKPGDIFDPAIHECIEKTSLEECEIDSQNKSIVVDKIIRRGYFLGEKLLKPSQVTVKLTTDDK